MFHALLTPLFFLTPLLKYLERHGRALHLQDSSCVTFLIVGSLVAAVALAMVAFHHFLHLKRGRADVEARLSLVMDAVNDGFWDWDMRTGECMFSPQWYRQLGYDPLELPPCYDTWKSLLHPEDAAHAEQALKWHIARNEPFSFELRMREKSGQWRWILTRGKVVAYDAAGAPIRMVGTHSDISARKIAEEETQWSRAFLNSIVENIPAMLFVKEAKDLKFVLWNKAGEDLVGFYREQLLGKSDFDFFPAEQAQAFISKDREVLNGRTMLDIPEEPLQTMKKGLRFLHTKKIPILDDKGNPAYLLGISEDITEQKHLELTQRTLSSAIEQTTDAVLITDGAGVITYVNPAFEQLTGYSRAEAIGQNPRLLKAGQVPAETYETLWKTILAGQTYRNRFTNRKKNGDLYVADISIMPIKESDGRTSHFVGIQKDITASLHMERALLQTEKLASIGQLASGVAHELNNPLSGVLGFTQLLLEDPTLTEQQRADLQTIHTQSQRCKSIIQNMLQFSRPKDPRMESLDLIALVRSTLQLVDYEYSTSGVTIRLECGPEIPRIKGDAGALQQVLVNLLTNARHALEKTVQPTLSIQVSATDETAIVRVSDNGPGIPEKILGKIFDPFFTTKAPGKGTGLGLSICHTIVRQHHGELLVESEPGQGATFTIRVPRVSAAQVAETAA